MAIYSVPLTAHSTTACPLTYEFSWFDQSLGSWTSFSQVDLDSSSYLTGTEATGQVSTTMTKAIFEGIAGAPYNDFSYRYRWVVTDPRSTEIDNSYTTELTVTYKHGCQSDEITLVGDLPSMTVALFDSYTATVGYSQTSGGGCSLTYLFEIYDTASDAWESYSNSAPHSHYITSYVDDSVTVSASDALTNQQYDQVSI